MTGKMKIVRSYRPDSEHSGLTKDRSVPPCWADGPGNRRTGWEETPMSGMKRREFTMDPGYSQKI
jgi:hypothetical protein